VMALKIQMVQLLLGSPTLVVAKPVTLAEV
jgi:hypothetical protein